MALDLDTAVCERARIARDARFDGRFFTGVLTTGVYCRPICPVRPSRARNVRFYPSAAAAAEAGFRPCLRCRPESAPGAPAWCGTSVTVARALRLIQEGALDDAGVESLAERLGVGPRHLSRLFETHFGASPSKVAQTRRVHLAKKLIDETNLPMTQVAFAAGFKSVRRFNEVVRVTYGRPPSALRRRPETPPTPGDETLRLRLAFRPPLAWHSLLEWLAAHAVDGVERIAGGRYRRTIALGGDVGWLGVSPVPGRSQLEIEVRFPNFAALAGIVARARRNFDLDADTLTIGCDLSHDPFLASLLRERPGLRVPGAWDAGELAVRAIIEEGAPLADARALLRRVTRALGRALGRDGDSDWFVFPSLDALGNANLASLGLTAPRARAVRRLARSLRDGSLELETPRALDDVIAALGDRVGLDPHACEYVALRALGDPDAFPARDPSLRRRAEGWRPWRAYAALHLWADAAAPSTVSRAARR